MAMEWRWDDAFLKTREEVKKARDFERRFECDWLASYGLLQRYYFREFSSCPQRVCRRARRCFAWPPVCPRVQMSVAQKQELLEWIYAGIQRQEKQKALEAEAVKTKR